MYNSYYRCYSYYSKYSYNGYFSYSSKYGYFTATLRVIQSRYRYCSRISGHNSEVLHQLLAITKNVFPVLSDDWEGTHENTGFSLLYPICFRIFAWQLMPLLVFHSSCPFQLWNRKISTALKSNRQKPFGYFWVFFCQSGHFFKITVMYISTF